MALLYEVSHFEGVTVSENSQYHDPETEASEGKLSIIPLIFDTLLLLKRP